MDKDTTTSGVLLSLYLVGMPLAGLGFFIQYLNRIDGILDLLLYIVLSSIKAIFWPITIWF